MTDLVEDLVADGRQGIVSTIPGENLLHAEVLKERLSKRTKLLPDGSVRTIVAAVLRGNQKDESREALMAFDRGEIDVLLFCDLISEGWTSKKASFFINGRPTTSVVNLTQQVGRVMELKEREAIVVDFIDKSVGKKQRTLFEVLELDRAVQGVRVGPDLDGGEESDEQRKSLAAGLFREDLMEALNSIDMKKMTELLYSPRELAANPYEVLRHAFAAERAAELKRLSKQFGRLLAKEGLAVIGPDYLGASKNTRQLLPPYFDAFGEPLVADDGTTYLELNTAERSNYASLWTGLLGAYDSSRSRQVILPVVPASSTIQSWTESTLAPTTDNLEGIQVSNEQLLRVSLALEELDERQKAIIASRFGLEGGNPKTFEDVAAEFGVTRERVRQIEAKALAQVRRNMYTRATQDVPPDELVKTPHWLKQVYGNTYYYRSKSEAVTTEIANKYLNLPYVEEFITVQVADTIAGLLKNRWAKTLKPEQTELVHLPVFVTEIERNLRRAYLPAVKKRIDEGRLDTERKDDYKFQQTIEALRGYSYVFGGGYKEGETNLRQQAALIAIKWFKPAVDYDKGITRLAQQVFEHLTHIPRS